jgi:hypothetical protein
VSEPSAYFALIFELGSFQVIALKVLTHFAFDFGRDNHGDIALDVGVFDFPLFALKCLDDSLAWLVHVGFCVKGRLAGMRVSVR